MFSSNEALGPFSENLEPIFGGLLGDILDPGLAEQDLMFVTATTALAEPTFVEKAGELQNLAVPVEKGASSTSTFFSQIVDKDYHQLEILCSKHLHSLLQQTKEPLEEIKNKFKALLKTFTENYQERFTKEIILNMAKVIPPRIRKRSILPIFSN